MHWESNINNKLKPKVLIVDDVPANLLALNTIAEWLSAGYTDPCISVNASALQFEEKEFSDFVEKTIANVNIPPSLLGIEITETLFLESMQNGL